SAAERLAEARAGLDTAIAARKMGLVGIATILGLAVLRSSNRRMINWRLGASALAPPTGSRALVLKTEAGRAIFSRIGELITALLGFQEEGARFVFGNLVQSSVPVAAADGSAVDGTAMVAQTGAYFAFNVLPTIIFFSALMSVMY